MLTNQLLVKLTPAHLDILPILVSIREKYDIPEIAPGDETLAEIAGVENIPDLEALRDEIELELRKTPDIFPKKVSTVYQILDAKENDYPSLEKNEFSPIMLELTKQLLGLLKQFVEPLRQAFDIILSILTDHRLEYLLTGTARELPFDYIIPKSPFLINQKIFTEAFLRSASSPDQANCSLW